MTYCLSPISGRLVIRHVSQDSGALLGVLRFAKEVRIKESAGYLFGFGEDGTELYFPSVDEGPEPSTVSYGIDHLLRCPTWPALRGQAGLQLVRFVAADPSQNLWTVYGATRNLPALSASCDHLWFDIEASGVPRRIEAPASERGLTCAQLLTNLCVWPDAYGECLSLSQHPLFWRKAYLAMSEAMAQVGLGELTEEAFFQRVRSDEVLRQIAPLSLDSAYIRYLARLQALGGLTEDRPRNAAALAERDAKVRAALPESLAA